VKQRVLLLVAACLLPTLTLALGPHEVLVVANESSIESLEIAKEYCRLRQIPRCNLVRLRLSAPTPGRERYITPPDFVRTIWAPTVETMKSRGLDRQILAWAYSTGFPLVITTPEETSLTGFTFMRCAALDKKRVHDGAYASPLFAGPSNPKAAGLASQTFDVSAEWLRSDMPLPAMALGVTGERGNTHDEILASLQKSAKGDCTHPTGTVYLATCADIRSTTRDWQFPGVVKELQAAGVNAVITQGFPTGAPDILGLLSGTPDVTPEQYGKYLPGSFADHFTSAAAVFHGASQTKLSRWIAAGASGSEGTVTEPFAIWTKIPHARLFTHYAAGCTMIESVYQATRCPLQVLPVGDPLARPFAPQGGSVKVIRSEPTPGMFLFRAEVDGGKTAFTRLIYLLDGKLVAVAPVYNVPRSALNAGTHTVRAVAYAAGTVRSQIFGEEEFAIE
jgi:uncharacterized protein (TIGR03790 family)